MKMKIILMLLLFIIARNEKIKISLEEINIDCYFECSRKCLQLDLVKQEDNVCQCFCHVARGIEPTMETIIPTNKEKCQSYCKRIKYVFQKVSEKDCFCSKLNPIIENIALPSINYATDWIN